MSIGSRKRSRKITIVKLLIYEALETLKLKNARFSDVKEFLSLEKGHGVNSKKFTENCIPFWTLSTNLPQAQ